MDLERLAQVHGQQDAVHDEPVPFLAERIVRARLAVAIAKMKGGLHPVMLIDVPPDCAAIAVECMKRQIDTIVTVLLSPNPVLTVATAADARLVHAVCGFELARTGRSEQVMCIACDVQDVPPQDIKRA